MGFVHLDVKPDNIVVSKEKGNKLYLIDYGISEQFMVDDKHRTQKNVKYICGNLIYIWKFAFDYKS